MAPQQETGTSVHVAELLAGAGADADGVLWSLTAAGRQLDADVVRLPPGSAAATRVEDDLDVLLYVTSGGGVLHSDARRQALEPGCVVSLPRGSRHSVHAGPYGLVHLRVRRRPPVLSVHPIRAGEAEAPGGEGACQLHRVCPECGRLAPDGRDVYCGRCGHRLDD